MAKLYKLIDDPDHGDSDEIWEWEEYFNQLEDWNRWVDVWGWQVPR